MNTIKLNPLLVEACVLERSDLWGFSIKHCSKSTDMSSQLFDYVEEVVAAKKIPRRVKVDVRRFDDGRVSVYVNGDINHPDDTMPFEKLKDELIEQFKAARLFVPA